MSLSSYTDISKSRDYPPVQPLLTTYPKTLMGDRKRSFKAEWYKIHPWLEYSRILDKSVFESGFNNWKKATYKEGGFRIHARSECHKQAMVAWKDYETAVKNNRTLLNVLNKEHDKQIKDNREYMKTIAEVLLLTATQNIAQRGHDESAESDNRGNFIAILETIAKHDKTLKKRLHSIHNAKYTSKAIQNEVLSCLADMVRTKIIEVFSIMADETQDIKKKKQISLVLRYYYSGAIHESFLHFESADQVNAAGLTEKIIHMLESHGLEYRDNLVGQSYDGASVMSGKHAGVQARIKDVAKHAFYIHCSAHCLHLVLVDTVKERSGSHVHKKWLAVQREMFEGAPRELQRLSDTRWACRYISLRNTLDRLPSIKRVLQEVVEEHNGDRSVEAQGLLAQLDLKFIVHLVTLCKIFGEARLLSDILQFSGHCVLSTTGGRRVDASKGGFCSYFFYPVIDQMLSQLSRRFSNQNCNIMNGIQALNPKSDAFLKEDVLFSLGRMYSSTIEDLGHEIHQFRRILDRKIQCIYSVSSTVELASFMEPYSEVFFELFKLCEISVAIPISTASCERSFSTLKLVKTHLRSTMADERVSNLGVLSIESKRANELNLDEFVDLFARNHKNRRIQLL
uniref:TTF-type domain-containing protein n=1 Tax=Sinocyclocheilus rhinocerous TaxID=307959 RepID=A0A673HRZ6_9TELE